MRTVENIELRFHILQAKQKSSGFSLLEVMVAVALLSLAIVTILQLYSMNLNSARKADLYTQAIILARSVMDETLSSPDLEDTGEHDTIDDTFDISKTVTQISEDDDDLAKTYEIQVNISWSGGAVELKTRKSIIESSE